MSIENWRDYLYRNREWTNNDSKRSVFNYHKDKLVNADVIVINGDYCKILDPELIKLGALEETIEEALEND